jgi:hypothetical protein
MTEQNGTSDKVPIVLLGPGEAHLQHEIKNYRCKICKTDDDTDTVLLHAGKNELVMACVRHVGVVQEFVRQFGRPPLGWNIT